MASFNLIDNSPQVLAALENQIKAALEACGQQAVTHSKQNITSAGRRRSGTLINSMDHLVREKTCYIGTNTRYAIYNEVGTGIYAGGRQTPWSYQDEQGNWHRTRGMKGIHFLKNAVAGHASEYIGIIKQYLKR